MPFLDRSSAENLGQNRPLPITPMSPLSSESLQEEEEDVLHTQEGWKTDIPVIIASNRLPVRLIRLPVVDTSPSNNKSKKDTRKNKQQEENTNLMDDNNNNNNNYRRKWSIEWASDRIIEAQNSFSHHEISEKANIKWVGRLPDVDLLNEKEKEEVDQLLLQFNCYAVYVPKEEAKLYYEQYCKQTLWPTFHNIIDLYSPVDVTIDDDKDTNKPSHYWTPGSQKIAWQAYANVNQQFAHVSKKNLFTILVIVINDEKTTYNFFVLIMNYD
jgi:trehalose-6-phosphate synthase